MEPMVLCALGIAVYFGYLTVRDIAADLQQEGILVKVQASKKNREISSTGIFAKGGRLRCAGGLLGVDFGLVTSSYSAGSISGNVWGDGSRGSYYSYHANGRRSRG